MANPQPLAQLRDIHLPAPVGWWPLAPGWYALSLIIMGLSFVALYFIYQVYIHGRAKRQALQLLETYVTEYQKDNNSQLISAKISELLRRVALVYFPRRDVASLQGQAWLDFLNQTSQSINFNPVRECLLELPYQQNKDMNIKPLLTRTRAWIKQRRRLCSD